MTNETRGFPTQRGAFKTVGGSVFGTRPSVPRGVPIPIYVRPGVSQALPLPPWLRGDIRTAIILTLAFAAYDELYKLHLPTMNWDMTGWSANTTCEGGKGTLVDAASPATTCYTNQARVYPPIPGISIPAGATVVHEWKEHKVLGGLRWNTQKTFTRPLVGAAPIPKQGWHDYAPDKVVPMPTLAPPRVGPVLYPTPRPVPWYLVPYLPTSSPTGQGRSAGYAPPAAVGAPAPPAAARPAPPVVLPGGQVFVPVLPGTSAPSVPTEIVVGPGGKTIIRAMPHALAPPKPGERQIKLKYGALGGVTGAIGFVTEFNDLINAFYNALPRWVKPRPRFYRDLITGKWRTEVQSPLEKLDLVYKHWDELDPLDVARRIALQEAGDAIYGEAGRQKARGAKATGLPTLYPFNHPS